MIGAETPEQGKQMAENNRISDEYNKTAENEFNVGKYSESEENRVYAGEFYSGEENQVKDLSDGNSESAENGADGINKTAFGDNGGLSAPASSFTANALNAANAEKIAATANTVKAVSGGYSILYKIIMGIVAFAGALIIGTNFVNGTRKENARFIKTETEDRYVSICVEVIKWSEDLKIRITGKDFVDELYIEPTDFNEELYYGADDYSEKNQQWLSYYAEKGEIGDELVLEIIGSPVFMSEVIDKTTVILTEYRQSEEIDGKTETGENDLP